MRFFLMFFFAPTSRELFGAARLTLQVTVVPLIPAFTTATERRYSTTLRPEGYHNFAELRPLDCHCAQQF